ncbi:hypothetical protein [Beggiatoa leptomitoformis]|uniref:AAA family ATPase n=1 Tax=Beggiatoa leptomitoformis TaxID=288004 RepID=A0A2N9YGM0_9GAMM|nr:hypothetical protein [Beggiatoa leptomitoformis]ALG68042.1 hypothetical protein AL038_10415 [Beggiatoa leptomitoformis]AUI69668.1 hypothetical protein BLE401_13860 [Beggiatoa leptomitoformis]
MTDRYVHCLRPHFTEQLLNTFQRKGKNGIAINLIGEVGQGKRRLLADIKRCRPEETQVLLADMAVYKENYDKLIANLWQQVDNHYKADKPVATELWDIIRLFEKTNHYLIILLANFDQLLNNPTLDKKYKLKFFDNLNTMRQHNNMMLICVTQQPHHLGNIFLEGEFYRQSWLNLQEMTLPSLTRNDIITELVKRQKLSLTVAETMALIQTIQNHTRPYALLEYFARKFSVRQDKHLNITERTKKWEAQFNEMMGISRWQLFYDSLKKAGIYIKNTILTKWAKLKQRRLRRSPIIESPIIPFVSANEALKNQFGEKPAKPLTKEETDTDLRPPSPPSS